MTDDRCPATGHVRHTRKTAAAQARRWIHQLTRRHRTIRHCPHCGSWHVVRA
jgi:hypothetical protein